ncbi:MAG: sensor domain-containing diguanylate cyclase [Acidimicrobiales bacterium]
MPPLADADRALTRRMELAADAAARQVEDTIQRTRTWCVVVAMLMTALYHGHDWWVGWIGVTILVATTTWTRWALLAERGGDRLPLIGTVTLSPPGRRGDRVGVGPTLTLIGAVSMAGDVLAVGVIMANLLLSPDDPIQLLPLLLVLEAATRWGRAGGILGGFGGGAMAAAWAMAVHHRVDADLPPTYLTFRVALFVLVGAMIGNTVQEARLQRRAADAVFNASRDLVATFSLDGELRSVNPACEPVLGYTPEELLGRDRTFLLDPDDLPFGPPDVDRYRREGARMVEVRCVGKDGRLVWIELDLLPDLRSGLVYAIGRDVSDRRRAESELRHRVDHDGLTGVWNRDALLAYLDRMVERGYQPGLVFIDLDRFKEVNDSYGHVAGDRVLAAVADRLCRAASNDGTVGRYAGDEFCIVVDDPDDLEPVTERVRTLLADPIDAGPVHLVVAATLGTAVCRTGDSSESLVDRADRAMYEGKARGSHR